MTDFRLDGRTILITGSSRGLGLAMAEACAGAGATVVLNGRDAEAVDARAKDFSGRGLRVDTAVFDVRDEAAGRDALETIAERHGALHGLINNAGQMSRSPFLTFETADFKSVLDTHLVSAFILARTATRLMLNNPKGPDRGRIVSIGSVLSARGRPNAAAYVSAKHALSGLTRSMAVELGGEGITCNGIAPGYFATELAEPLLADSTFNEWVSTRTPAGRWGEVSEIGGAAVFLMSSAASYVNGHLLFVDGGMTAAL